MHATDMTQAILRGAHLISLLSLFGILIFLAAVAPAALEEAGVAGASMRRRLVRLARGSTAFALGIGIAWLIIQAAVIAGANSAAAALHAVPLVALHTQFGRSLLVRFALLIAVLPLVGARRLGLIAAITLAGMALGLQPFIGHAGAIGGRTGAVLLSSELMHLLAAGAWLGGLLPLILVLALLPLQAAATACRGFSAVGLPAVLILVGTALVQASDLIGSLPGLLGTAYGRVALLKLVLFLILLALAALNRFALTKRLTGAVPTLARRRMRRSVSVEMALGALVIIAAAFLASLTPGLHQQPVWPLPWRPSLEAMAEPELRHEVIAALIAVAGAIVIGLIGSIWRRWRWPLLSVSVGVFALAIPHLGLLFVEAYPSSFFTSPTEFAASAITYGAKLYQANCASCHGANGHGGGPAAQTLPLPPADLTAAHLWAHSDGELFWYLSHGMENPKGGLAMPGFAGILSTEARWDLIDYLRANNAGESMRTSGKWSHPVPVPQFDADCADGRTIDLDDLRGRILRIIAGSEEDLALPVLPAGVDATTIVLARNGAVKPVPAACVAREPETWWAFAIILGVSQDALGGTQIAADKNGWLRARWRPDESIDPGSLSAEIRDLSLHPLAFGAEGRRAHHH